MGIFGTTQFNDVNDLFIEQIEDLYDAENRLVNALPKMAEAADSTALADAFREHLSETNGHVKRLEQVFKIVGKQPERETCEAMKGLIKEGEEMIEAQGDPSVKDAALIAAAQRIEHYEIAGYGTARNLARRVGLSDAASLLQETLNEEGDADKKLTQIAEQLINPRAAHATAKS